MQQAVQRNTGTCGRLEAVFAGCFSASENTLLLGGAAEPLYQPAASATQPHRLYYREDYAASALHEIAHWCIAGSERRKLLDFGYWYAPEGRSAQQQREFEQVEVKPQALEWLFTLACDWPFRISVDNFGAKGELPDTTHFRRQVLQQARHYCRNGLPPRAQQFFTALAREFNTDADTASLQLRAQDLE